MIVHEMHIQLDLRLQRLNSDAFDIFYKEEKDLIFDYVQNLFVRRSLPSNEGNKKNEGFQNTSKRYSDIQTLVTKRTLPCYRKADNVLFCVLPFDYCDYITVRANLNTDCRNFDLGTTNVAELFIAYLPFDDSAFVGDIFNNFKWTLEYSGVIPDLVIADRADYPNFPTVNYNDEKFVISKFAIYEVNRKDVDVKVYWERYGEIYRPNNFIFITENDTVETIVMNTTGAGVVTADFSSLGFNQYSVTGNLKTSPTRLIETQFVDDFLVNPFQTTGIDSPIIEMATNEILIHHTSKFICKTIDLHYIRKPKPICHYLNVSCELHEARHDKIVDMAYDVAAAYIGNPRDVKMLSNFINQNNE